MFDRIHLRNPLDLHCFWKFINWSLNFSDEKRIIQFAYLSFCKFWWFLSFKQLVVHFIKCTKSWDIELFIIFLYYPINIHMIINNDPSFISNINKLYLLFYSWLAWSDILKFCSSFQRTSFLFHWIYLLMFIFNFTEFCPNFYNLFSFTCFRFILLLIL